MKYTEVAPCAALSSLIHSFWELRGSTGHGQWERIFPDGCAGVVINLGDSCKTDNGLANLDRAKTYAVGAMTSFKDSFIDESTHLMGVCLKPAAFSSFYTYTSQREILNRTVKFDAALSFDFGKVQQNPLVYLNRYFLDRKKVNRSPLQSVLDDIHTSKGRLSIAELSKRNYLSARHLERHFNAHVGLSPKEYNNVVRFQYALSLIQNPGPNQTFADIAFECGFYDQAHLTNEIRKHTGRVPSQV